MTKTAIVKIDGALAMAVLPASRHVDLSQLRTAAGAKNAELASEEEFKGPYFYLPRRMREVDDSDRRIN